MRLFSRSLFVVAVAGCGEVKSPVMPDAAAPPTFTVVGNVYGLAGTGLVLQLNGAEELTPTTEGAFGFTTEFAEGASYTVTVKSQPSCPVRRCTLVNATGTVSASTPPVEVTCEKPKQRLFAGNWGESSIRVTDDVLSHANNTTALPRIITGANTQITGSELDSVAYDDERDRLYMASSDGVVVFQNGATAMGNIAPTTRLTITGETNFYGIEIDAAVDRLYVAGTQGVYVIDMASTRTGLVTPAAKFIAENPSTDNAGTITLDRKNDRLFIGGDYTNRVHVFDNARAITSATTASRTFYWDLLGTFDGPPAIAIDTCRDRLYLGSNDTSTNGYNLFAFNNASTLTGMINPETASQAQLIVPGMQAISAEVDSEGYLYWWTDSPTKVSIAFEPHLWMGPLTVGADLTVNGVVASGYGLDVVQYY